MTKEQYLNLRAELKALAKQIRETKTNYKQSQRDFSKVDTAKKDYYDGKINSTKWELSKPDYDRLYKNQLHLFYKTGNLSHDYRLKHIVYCLARGRTREQIEPKVSKYNKVDEKELVSMIRHYEESVA